MHLNPSTLNLNIVKSISYIFSIILAFCFLTSCQNADIDRKLDKADAMLDQHPDSALALLQTIDRSSIHKTESTARYSILLFAAAMKNGLSVDPDSILTPAAAYYGEKDNPSREKMLTHFFYAVYLSNNNQPAAGIKEYDKAITVGEQIGDILYTGLAYTNKGVSYGWDNIGDEELEFTRRGLEKIRLTNDTARLIHALCRYGLAAMHNAEYTLADSIFNDALALSVSTADTVSLIDTRMRIACNEYFRNNIHHAASIYSDIYCSAPELMSAFDYGLWGMCGTYTNDIPQAEKCAFHMEESLTSCADSITWFSLKSDIAKLKGDFQSALSLKDSVIYYSNKSVEETMAFNLLHGDKELLKIENEFYKKLSDQQKNIILLIVVASLFAGATLLCVSLYFGKRKRLKVEQQNQQLEKAWLIMKNLEESSKEKDALISGLENIINEFKERIRKLEISRNELRELIENKDKEIVSQNDRFEEERRIRGIELNYLSQKYNDAGKELEQAVDNLAKLENNMASYRQMTIRTYKNANADVSDQICKSFSTENLVSGKGKSDEKRSILSEFTSDKKIESLTAEVNIMMENIIDRILSEHSLETKERKILVYTIAGFKYRAIALLLGMNPSTVSAMKTRLKSKLMVESSPNYNLFRKYYSA